TPVARRPRPVGRTAASTSMTPVIDGLAHPVEGDHENEAHEVIHTLDRSGRRMSTLARPHLHRYLPDLELPRGGQQQRLDGVGEILGRVRDGKSLDGPLAEGPEPAGCVGHGYSSAARDDPRQPAHAQAPDASDF